MTHMEQCTEKVLQDGICLELCDHRISTPPHSHFLFPRFVKMSISVFPISASSLQKIQV